MPLRCRSSTPPPSALRHHSSAATALPPPLLGRCPAAAAPLLPLCDFAAAALPPPLRCRRSAPAALPLLICPRRSAVAAAQPRPPRCRCSVILPPLPLGSSAAPPPHRLRGTASVAPPSWLRRRRSATVLQHCLRSAASTTSPQPPHLRRPASAAPPPPLRLHRRDSASTAVLRDRSVRARATAFCRPPLRLTVRAVLALDLRRVVLCTVGGVGVRTTLRADHYSSRPGLVSLWCRLALVRARRVACAVVDVRARSRASVLAHARRTQRQHCSSSRARGCSRGKRCVLVNLRVLCARCLRLEPHRAGLCVERVPHWALSTLDGAGASAARL